MENAYYVAVQCELEMLSESHVCARNLDSAEHSYERCKTSRLSSPVDTI